MLEYGKVYLSLKAVWFPWFMLGYTQWDYPALIQIVSITGVYGLSAAICLSGALLASVAVYQAKTRKKILRFVPAALVFAGILVFGRQELRRASSAVPVRSVKAALLQPSIDLYAKWDAAQAGAVKADIENLAAGVKDADLALWPENALPCWIDQPECAAWLKDMVSSGTAAGTLLGSVSKGDGRHVSAFLLDGKGEITASYNKRQLVPFGEYVPFRDFLGKYVKPVATLGEFDPGEAQQKLLDFKGNKIGVAICYESVFPYLFSGDTLDGADFFVNITNDGWYLNTAAPYQHFIVNIFRAVENRRAVARAANNGISGVIDPWGRVSSRTKLNERGAFAASIPVYAGEALFPLYGVWFARTAGMIVAAFMLALVLV